MAKRGGKREGAGRPAKEKTVQVRIPVGALDLVRALIETYNQGLNTEPEIIYGQRQSDWTEPQEPPLKSEAKINNPDLVRDVAEAFSLICGNANRKDRRAMIARHGSLEKAAEFYVRNKANAVDKPCTVGRQ